MKVHRVISKLALFCAAMTLLIACGQPARAYDKGPEIESGKDYFAEIKTSKGSFFIKLFDDKTPVTVRNFVNLAEGTGEFKDPKSGEWVKRPYFDGIIFHRVISKFMVQTGDPLGQGTGGPGYVIRDEMDPSLNFTEPGLLGMANRGPGTGGSQFFITEVATPWLNQKHTIFGKLLEGSDGVSLVKEIANVPKAAGDKPITPITMEKVTIHRFDEGISEAEALTKIKTADSNTQKEEAEQPETSDKPAEKEEAESQEKSDSNG